MSKLTTRAFRTQALSAVLGLVAAAALGGCAVGTADRGFAAGPEAIGDGPAVERTASPDDDSATPASALSFDEALIAASRPALSLGGRDLPSSYAGYDRAGRQGATRPTLAPMGGAFVPLIGAGPGATPTTDGPTGPTDPADAVEVCDGFVVAVARDSANCGRCGHACLGGACEAGVCAPVALAPVVGSER